MVFSRLAGLDRLGFARYPKGARTEFLCSLNRSPGKGPARKFIARRAMLKPSRMP
jgi:hypothetical protein